MVSSEQLGRIIAKIRDFMREEVYPLERDFLNGGPATIAPLLREERTRVKELGLWAPHIPTTYGGMGLPLAWIIHEGQEATREPSGMV